MTRFGKTIVFFLLLIVAGGGYFYFSLQEDPFSVENFISENENSYTYFEETEYYRINAEYPKSGNAAADAELFVLSQVGEFKSIFDGFTTEDYQVLKESAAGVYVMTITYEEKIGNGFTTYVFTEYEYTGGAHGNTDIATLTYNASGKRISLKDLLKSDPQNLAALASLAQDGLLTDLGLGGVFYEGVGPELENFERFYFDEEYIVFIFPPYQVAAYALGTLEVKIPLVELFGYLKKDNFMSWYEAEGEHRGNIIFGGEVRAFSYCDGDKEYWYHDTTGSLKDEYEHAKLSEEPYEEVPVILRGYIREIPESESGFAEEYDGILVVSDLDQIGGGGVCE